MTRPADSYARAVTDFLALADAPLEAVYATPRALARSAGLSPSTGYRAIRRMEAAGFLHRDASGAYRRGDQAAAVGLSAFGMGDVAPVARAVLDHLRRDAGLTAALMTVDADAVRLGPFVFGRGAEAIRPIRQHLQRLDAAPPAAGLLRGFVADDGRRLALAAQAIVEGDGLHVGLLGPAESGATAGAADALRVAADRFAQARAARA